MKKPIGSMRLMDVSTEHGLRLYKKTTATDTVTWVIAAEMVEFKDQDIAQKCFVELVEQKGRWNVRCTVCKNPPDDERAWDSCEEHDAYNVLEKWMDEQELKEGEADETTGDGGA